MPSEVSCFRGIVRSAGWKEQRVTEELVRVAMGVEACSIRDKRDKRDKRSEQCMNHVANLHISHFRRDVGSGHRTLVMAIVQQSSKAKSEASLRACV